MLEIKPCFKCGGAPNEIEAFDDLIGIKCFDCEFEIGLKFCWEHHDYEESMESLIERWNRGMSDDDRDSSGWDIWQ
jgi:hypothetical protein